MDTSSPIGVIFDMDGVLVDSAAVHLRSWQLLASECDGVVTQERFAETFGRQNRDVIPMLFGEVPEPRIQTLADRKEEIYRELVQGHTPIVEGAVELVRALHQAGVRLAVGSSGPRENIALVLSAMGVGDCFPVVVSGADVICGKPDPQVFSLAADRLGVSPGRCVVIEDAPVGVQAARAAGVRSVAVLIYHPAEAFDHADLVASRLADLSVDQIVSLVVQPFVQPSAISPQL